MENRGNVSKSMRQAGYSPATAKNPKNLTESKGFLELCDELGLTDDLIVNALVDDIKAKPKNRKPELELAAKMKGRLTEKVKLETEKPIAVILREYGLTEEGGDARETDKPVSDASEGSAR